MWHWDTVTFPSFASTWSSEASDGEPYEILSSKAEVLGKRWVLS